LAVVVPGDCAADSPHRDDVPSADVPLAVSGTVAGRPVVALVTGLPDVLARIAAWTDEDPGALGWWGLREDYSEPLILPVRRCAGSAGSRVAHLVCLLPGERHGATLTARCGDRLSLVDVAVVAVGEGMPCEPCLTRQALGAGGNWPGIEQRGLQGAISRRLDRQIG
jgi:hypothetical protein